MGRFVKRGLAMLMVACMVVASVPQTVFAGDYDGHWAQNSIAKWSEKGLVVGYEDGTFRPSNAITRGELAAILVRVFEYHETSQAKEYADVVGDKWYADSVAKISSAGLMNDSGQNFRPEEAATREEASYAIAKAYKVTGSTDSVFKDQDAISDWASASVEALYSRGFISGNPDGTFAPKRTLTRADVVAMLDKITSQLINVAGTYTDDVDGNLVVNTRDVVLKDMTITGNLYLAEGIGDGDVTLENITVEGETFVNGGGSNSIKSINSKFLDGMKVSAKNPVRIVIEGDAVKIQAFPGATVTLTGNFSDVILPPGVNVIIKDAIVGKIFVQAGFAEDGDVEKAVVTIDEGSTVKEIQADAPVETKGKGKIENLIVNSKGVKTEQKPDKTDNKNKENKPETGGSRGGGGGSSGDDGGSGGGGSSNSGGGEGNTPSPEKPASKHYIKGKVTIEGKGIEYVYVDVWDENGEKFLGHTETDENGNYSLLVPGNKKYGIHASFLDTDRFAYQKELRDVAIEEDKTIDLALEKIDVANILVEDANGAPVCHAKLVETWEDGEDGWWWTDHEGYATIELYERSDHERSFDIYLEGSDEVMGAATGIKYTDEYRSYYKIQLAEVGITETVTGTIEVEGDLSLGGILVHIYEVDKQGDWSHSKETLTDKDGKYIFTEMNKKAHYIIHASYEDENNFYGSQEIDTRLAGKVPLVVKQVYSLSVKVVDNNNLPISDAQVRVMDENGWYMSNTGPEGYLNITYQQLVAGQYKVEVTANGQVMVKSITIPEGNYNHFLDFKFGDITQNKLEVEIEGDLFVQVGDKQVTPASITLGNLNDDKNDLEGEARADFDGAGKANLAIPKDFSSKEATLFIRDKEGVFIGAIDITLDGSKIVINLEEIPKLELSIDLESTTNSAITLKVASLHMTNRYGKDILDYQVKVFEVEGRVLEKGVKLNLNPAMSMIQSNYYIRVEYEKSGIIYKLDQVFEHYNQDEGKCEYVFYIPRVKD